MIDCIFCKIFKGEIPSQRVFENESVIGFKDLHPQAKTHLLFIHKNHSRDFCEMTKNDPQSLIDVMKSIGEYAEKSGLDKVGFRLVTNNGASAGQSVFHAHYHVLSSSKLGHFGE